MAFNIILASCVSDGRQLDKVYQATITLSGELKEGTSIIDPTVIVEALPSTLAIYNYMEIPLFQRKYFINDMVSIKNSLIEIRAHVDVLSSFAGQIRSNEGIIRKQENEWNLYLNDGTFKVYQNSSVLTTPFPSGFTTQELVLAIAGS